MPKQPLLSGVHIEDMDFKLTVLKYIEQDVKDKQELKEDLKSVKETITYQKVDIAVLQTKAGLVGVIASIVFSALFGWIFSMFKK